MTYTRDEFKLLIGEKTAENVKIAIGRVVSGPTLEAEIRGRDLVTGLPRQIIVTDGDIREAISASVNTLIDGIKEVLEMTPPEILSDIMHRGIVLVGGGGLIQGLDLLLQNVLKIPVYVAPDPLSAVARGTGIVLENIKDFQEILISTQDEIPPR